MWSLPLFVLVICSFRRASIAEKGRKWYNFRRERQGIFLDIKADVSLQLKQTLSQAQLQSLNILGMSMIELQEFLQNEEIENPMVEYSVSGRESELSVTYREYDTFYNGSSRDEDEEPDLYEPKAEMPTIEDLVTTQLSWGKMSEKERAIVDFCIHSLDQSGYLVIPAEEIAKQLEMEPEFTERTVSMLKTLEPVGIFASGLEECLLLQIEGMDEEENLRQIICSHLSDVAEGKISSISRALKLSSAEVRKLIQVIKGLNPRPLNGYGEEQVQFIIPDIILRYQDGQWSVSLNDKWSGTFQINEFYVHMMETAQDEELKQYFEEKLKRARFIVNAIEQRRKTMEGITEGILKRQAGYLLGQSHLKPMTLEEIADERGIHKSTVSRAIRDKYLLAPAGCFAIRSLFTTGISSGDGDGGEVSRNAVKDRLKALVDGENKQKPYSDDQLAKLLKDEGMSISRRTVAKYRTEMGILGTFQRRE